MQTAGRFGEHFYVSNEILTISSAAGANSLAYSCDDCDQISFIVGCGTYAASTALTATLNVQQAENRPFTTNTTVPSATGTLMTPSTANTIENARSILLTMSSAATLAETLTLNGYTLTYSTVPSTVATALAFGSTLGSTVAGGIDGTILSLSSVINNSTLSKWLRASSVSTAILRITVNDTASTDVNIASTGTNFAAVGERSQSIIDIKSEDLNSSSKYVRLAISSAATAVQVGITVVKVGMKNKPPVQVGQYVKTPTT